MDDGERIASGGISLQGWPIGEKADVGTECAAGRSRTRERIMNRLFISFSSVKLLRMARPREPRFLFHRRVMYRTLRVSRMGISLVSSL